MTEINLLPWREQRREHEKKLFTSMLAGGVVIAGLIIFLANSYVNHLVSMQIARNQILKDEISQLDKQIQDIKDLRTVRAGLISRMSIVQNLQSTRTLMVHLFDEMIKVMPAGIYITQMERKNDLVTIHGYADSNMSISQLMTNIEENAWIQNPALTEIKNIKEKAQTENNEFLLSFVLKPRTLGFESHE